MSKDWLRWAFSQRVPGFQFLRKGLYPLIQSLGLLAGLLQLSGQSVALLQRGAQLLQLGFQGGDLAGFVVAAAVELLFQRGGRLGKGYILLAGGEQRGDTSFQLRVPGDGQARLPDEGAALIYLPGHAQQRLAAVLAGEAGHDVPGTGIEGFEFPHGRALAPGGPHESNVPAIPAAVHPSGHEGTGPGGVAVFVRRGTGAVPLPAVDAIEHGEQKRAPGGFPGFIGGLQDVQARLQLQCIVLKAAKRGGHALDQQKITPKWESTVLYGTL